MTLTEARRIARDPRSATIEQLADSLEVVLNDDRLTANQVTNLPN